MNDRESGLCHVLDWDSAFFGFRIARLQSAHLTASVVCDVLGWCRREEIRCLYFLASSDSPETTRLAEGNGFRMADFRITLARELMADTKPTESVREFRESDLSSLRGIAAVSHRDSRFYYDPGFPDQRCNELYETWIERSCHGFADLVLVAEHRNQAAGYVSCHLHPDDTGTIGLLAVADGSRGVGIGGKLVTGALRFLEENGCKRAEVVTQGRNCAAQRLYQKFGFRSASVGVWYHRWFDRIAS